MNRKSDEIALSILYLSRAVFILAIVSILGAAVTNLPILILLGLFLGCVSWIAPGILIMLNMPWLAHSWLRGINTIWVPNGSWNDLTPFKKFSVYFYSLLLSIFMIFTLIEVVGKYFH